jgi:uncharacterized membrane protein YkvA (DUF1232 family)
MSRLSEKIELTRTQWLTLLVAIVYVVSPVDLVPGLIAGPIGLTDDLAAVALIATTALGGWKRAKGLRGAAQGPQGPTPAAPPS